MKKLFLLLAILLPAFLFAQSSKKKFSNLYAKPVERKYYVKERYFRGNLYVEGQAVQKIFSKKKRVELKRGPWKWYYRNGQVKDTLFYSDMGLPTGVETKYSSDGKILETIDYGTSTNFIIKERNWLTTIAKDYTRTYYYKNPNIPKETNTFLNKKRNGVWQTFDKTGKVIYERKYEKGRLISETKY